MVKVRKSVFDAVDLKTLKGAKETWKILQARKRKAKKAARAPPPTKTGQRSGGYYCGDCGEPKGAYHDCIFVSVLLNELVHLVSEVQDDEAAIPLQRALDRYRSQCGVQK